MDMTSFVLSYSRSKQKGVSGRDAVKVGVLGAAISAGNPALGIVIGDRLAERYAPLDMQTPPGKPTLPGKPDRPQRPERPTEETTPDWGKAISDKLDRVARDLGEVKRRTTRTEKALDEYQARLKALENRPAATKG